MDKYEAQALIEARLSKKNIASWIEEDVGDIANNEVAVECAKLIKEWRVQDYYPQKMKRIQALTGKSSMDIVIQLFYSVLSISGVEQIQSTATKFANALDLEGFYGVKTASEIIALCHDAGLYEFIDSEKVYDEETDEWTSTGFLIKPLFTLEEDTSHNIHMTQYLPPMIVEPMKWTSNTSGGYLVHKHSCILGSANHHDLPQATDVLNKLQSIEWSLNKTMLQEEELPKEEYDVDEDKDKIESHNARVKQSNKVYRFTQKHSDNKFYLVWKFDKRGRCYSQGYDINLQSSEYKKSILQFANPEIVKGF